MSLSDGRSRGLVDLPIRNAVAIASGKGGVGKSTVAVNVAVVLAQSGARVGLDGRRYLWTECAYDDGLGSASCSPGWKADPGRSLWGQSDVDRVYGKAQPAAYLAGTHAALRHPPVPDGCSLG